MVLKISAEKFAKVLDAKIFCEGNGDIVLAKSEVNRPGLQFTGFYTHFDEERLQLIGNAEMHYLYSLSEAEQKDCVERFMKSGIPCIVCARNNEPPKPLVDAAKKYKIPLFVSPVITGELGYRINNFIKKETAPMVRLHGVFLDVFGVGILLMGESGMGKSETALEMIKEGHRLVADDVVEVTKVASDRLSGSAPELTKHLLEVRGIGLIDVRYLYGVGAVIQEKTIDFVIEMELWNEHANYERTGLSEQKTEILGVSLPCAKIPVSPGRNLAIVIEAAARNFRLKKLGYNAALEFDKKLFGDSKL